MRFCHRFLDRIFMPDISLRRLVKRYARGGQTVNGKKVDVLTTNDKSTMMANCSKICPVLYEFLAYVDVDGSNVSPDNLQYFLFFTIFKLASLCIHSRQLHSQATYRRYGVWGEH